MACQRSLLLLLYMTITLAIHLSKAQHWSQSWKPGGKREIDQPQSPEVKEIKPCKGEDCTFLKILRENIVTPLQADVLAKKKK